MQQTTKLSIPKNVIEKLQTIEEAGHEAYIVGGASLYYYAYKIIGNENYNHLPKDHDIFTNASAEQLIELFNCKPIGGQDRLNKIFTVITEDGIEISTYRSDGKRLQTGANIYEHQETCDFTINAIAIDINGNYILPDEVTDHIQNQILVTMGNPEDRISEDHNRIMRCIRIAAKYNLFISSDLFNTIKETNINKILPEVIHDELIKIASYDGGLLKLYQSDLLYKIFPHMSRMEILVGRGIYHEETVIDHTLKAIEIIENLTNDPIIKIAMLLHDYGKVSAYNPETHKFTNHDAIGAKELEPVLKNLKFTNAEQKQILWIVENHMWAKESVTTRRKKWYKFFNSMKDHGVNPFDFFKLQYADTMGRKINDHWLHDKNIPFDHWLYSQPIHQWHLDYTSQRYPQTISDLKIKGTDLIMLGIKPSDKFTKILNRLWEMCLVGELQNDQAQIIKLISKWIENKTIEKL